MNVVVDNQFVRNPKFEGFVAPPIGFGSRRIEVRYIDTSALAEAHRVLCGSYGHLIMSGKSRCNCGLNRRRLVKVYEED